MLKQKITGIIMGTLMISGVVIGTSSINNTKITNDNTKVVNKVLLASPSSLVGERAVVVNTDNSPLVLYSSASGNSNITSYISGGEMLTIQSSGDNFYKVKVQETGVVGYISAHNLQIITSGVNDSYNAVNKKGYIINVSSRVNLRANATMSSNVLAKLSNNTKINVLGKQGQWYKVNCNGTVGYIYQEYVGLTNTNLDISNTKQLTNTSPKTTNIKSSNNLHGSSKINNDNNSISKGGYIKWVEPINPKGTPLSKYIFINLNDTVVKNTTGKNISDNLLAEFMRKWILEGQNSCMGIYGYESTGWLPQWLNKVIDDELIEAFIDANGEKAFSENITANEFNKATMKLLSIVEQKPEPFTLAQVSKIIHQLFPDSIITKIKPVQDAYYVYTKQSGDNIYVVVNAYTGNYIA